MAAAQYLSGHQLPGRRLNTTWDVLDQIAVPIDRTPGGYSVGYRVRSKEGREAFMKVSDLDLLTNSEASLFERMSIAFHAYKFEREILEYCRGNNMDRIAVAIDFGDCPITINGVQDAVFYLIFELAQCDARVQMDTEKEFNLAWRLGALHDLSIAIGQLHAGKVSHNDIKPANFLVIAQAIRKLADLGHATSTVIAGIYDGNHSVGDPRFAAPEILYAPTPEAQARLCDFDGRRASDIYQLGSMVHFLMTGRMLTPEVLRALSPEHRPENDNNGWTGEFGAVLPYWREALTRVLEEFKRALPRRPDGALTETSARLFDVVVQLCEPDPSLRGHPSNRRGQSDRYGVERYTALFDFLQKQAARH